MKKVIEILKDEDNDRYIFLHIDKEKEKEYCGGIYGINFHQGIEEIVFDFHEPDIHLTEIWRRITLRYPNIEYYYLIDRAIELYIETFIFPSIKK
jgi:hypothetical protein